MKTKSKSLRIRFKVDNLDKLDTKIKQVKKLLREINKTVIRVSSKPS